MREITWMVFPAAERRQPILHKTLLINQGNTREAAQMLFCFNSNAWHARSRKPPLVRYLTQADGSTSNQPHQLSSTLHPLGQTATIRLDPVRERKSNTHRFGSMAVRRRLCLQHRVTEAPQKLEEWENHTSPYLQDREGNSVPILAPH